METFSKHENGSVRPRPANRTGAGAIQPKEKTE